MWTNINDVRKILLLLPCYIPDPFEDVFSYLRNHLPCESSLCDAACPIVFNFFNGVFLTLTSLQMKNVSCQLRDMYPIYKRNIVKLFCSIRACREDMLEVRQ